MSKETKPTCVTVLGLTFKENVPDTRNSKVVDIVRELQSFGIEVQVHDPFAISEDVQREYGISLMSERALRPADAVILAVAHATYLTRGWSALSHLLRNGKGVVMDVKAKLDRHSVPDGVHLWRL